MSRAEGAREPAYCFEQGPIRPPNEATSLLIRVTRNCPWNRCAFCPVYKGKRFSVRAVEDVKADIDAVHAHVCALREVAEEEGGISRERLEALAERVGDEDMMSFSAAAHWFCAGGMKSIFLQDADSLVIKTRDLVKIIGHLRRRFGWVERITSYSRSRTIASKREADLTAIRESGLSRIHVGLESGSDEVLNMVRKGATKAVHIEAGRKAKEAGLELSEYIMPGLGGRALREVHARETADALNQIDPDFIRIRTLAVSPSAPLWKMCCDGAFEPCSDVEVAEELLMLIEGLEGIGSTVKSDHILNLFEDLEGKLPDDKERMVGMLRRFLDMDAESQGLYQVGRRLGVFAGLGDLEDRGKRDRVDELCRRMGVTSENVDEFASGMMRRFV
ncbi:MAG: radical SAM protein [Phycisphaerales bacterium]|nr:MAG: radical SAM protein [Phycisphaerales bacterium]